MTPSHKLVFTFTSNVVSGNASVVAGIGSVSGLPIFADKTMSVDLVGVSQRTTDRCQINQRHESVLPGSAGYLPDTEVAWNVLLGDTAGADVSTIVSTPDGLHPPRTCGSTSLRR